MHRFIPLMMGILLAGCAVPPAVTGQYAIQSYRAPHVKPAHQLPTIHVSTPEAVTSLETTQMLYSKFLYESKPFVHNAWISTPPEMLYPLFVRSVVDSQAFDKVSTGSHTESFHYRLNTQILKLLQNFNTKPSTLDLVVAVGVVSNDTGELVASRLFTYRERCPYDTPYGGVVAANRASERLTFDVTTYAIRVIKRHQHKKRPQSSNPFDFNRPTSTPVFQNTPPATPAPKQKP